MNFSRFILVLLSWASSIYAQDYVAIITLLEGNIIYQPVSNFSSQPKKLDAFMKINTGDILELQNNARARILYFTNGRQELWQDAIKLEITPTESRSAASNSPQLNDVPLVLAQQIKLTPSLDSAGHIITTRLRALPIPQNTNTNPQNINNINKTYKKMRSKLKYDDLSPELYLLSAMFELKEFDRIAEILIQLKSERPNNQEVKLLVSLYERALRDARTQNSIN